MQLELVFLLESYINTVSDIFYKLGQNTYNFDSRVEIIIVKICFQSNSAYMILKLLMIQMHFFLKWNWILRYTKSDTNSSAQRSLEVEHL